MPALFINTNPGVVPTKVAMANRQMSQATAVPADRSLAASIRDQDGRYPDLNSVVDNLGMSWAQQGVWKTVIQRSLVGASNAIPLRMAIHAQAREQRLDPVTTRAILMRALQYVRQNPNAIKKAVALVLDLQKAKPPVPPVAKEDDDTDADDEDEDSDEDAPEDGDDVTEVDPDGEDKQDEAKEAAAAIEKLVGKGTVTPDDFSDLMDKYGVDLLASVLKAMLDEGLLKFDGQQFTGQFGKQQPLTVDGDA